MVKGDSSLSMNIKQYLVAGRKLPSDKDPEPTIYRMRIFASDEVRAKSRFWYFLKKMNKIKKAVGEVVSIKEVREKKTSHVKTYGLFIRYENREDYTNMYREYRDTSLCGAVGRMYQDMAGRHRARANTVYIIHTSIIPSYEKVKRSAPAQFYDSKIKFPLFHEKVRAPTKALRSIFLANRPLTRSH